MSMWSTFLEDIVRTPRDWHLRSIAADWCEENGQARLAECLRWMARHKKSPHGTQTGPATWFNADTVGEGLGDPESDIPGVVYSCLKGGREVAHHKSFDNVRAAEEAFHAAFARARQRGWRADGG